jgi:hypothetical protein
MSALQDSSSNGRRRRENGIFIGLLAQKRLP